MMIFTKKGDIGFIDLAFIFLFAIFVILIFIVFGIFENPLAREAEPAQGFRDIEAARVLQGMLSSHIYSQGEYITLAEYARRTGLQTQYQQKDFARLMFNNLEAYDSDIAGDKAYWGGMLYVEDAHGNELVKETYGQKEGWISFFTSAGSYSFFTVIPVDYSGRTEQIIPGYDGNYKIQFAMVGRAYTKIK